MFNGSSSNRSSLNYAKPLFSITASGFWLLSRSTRGVSFAAVAAAALSAGMGLAGLAAAGVRLHVTTTTVSVYGIHMYRMWRFSWSHLWSRGMEMGWLVVVAVEDDGGCSGNDIDC